MKLPIKLKQATIIEAISEFRYKNKLDIEEVFFIVRTLLEKEGFIYQKQTVMEMPPAVREVNPTLKYTPHYSFVKGVYIVNISPFMISFNLRGFYQGWDYFSKFIEDIYNQLNALTDRWELERTSMRYIDFFENTDIFDKIKIEITTPSNLCGNAMFEKTKNYVVEYNCDVSTSTRIQITNNLKIVAQDKSLKNGSVIDIDIVSTNISDNFKDTISNLHDTAKNTFFSIISEELQEELEPIYEKE